MCEINELNYDTRHAARGDFHLAREHSTVWLTPSVSMEQRSGIASFLK